MAFQYDREQSTSQKSALAGLQRVSDTLQRKLMQKVLDFLNRI